MDIKYDTMQEIARNADFEFEDEEEQQAYWEQIDTIESAYEKAVRLI